MINKALSHFKKGDVVIFPTDTVYGVGCRLSNEEAIKRVYEVRKDAPAKPQLILASCITQAFEYGFFDAAAAKFVEMFWPGPLTTVVKAKEKVPKAIRGRNGTVGIRIPDQPPILGIIRRLGEPILAPSANFHGGRSPTSFAEIDKGLIALVDYAFELRNQPDSKQMALKPSTLIDLTKRPYKVLRKGAFSLNKLKSLGGF